MTLYCQHCDATKDEPSYGCLIYYRRDCSLVEIPDAELRATYQALRAKWAPRSHFNFFDAEARKIAGMQTDMRQVDPRLPLGQPNPKDWVWAARWLDALYVRQKRRPEL